MESNVNNYCLTLSNAFTRAAHCTFKTTCMVCSKIDHENKHRAMPVFKDWFDSDCRQKRWLYIRKKNRYKHTKSNQDLIEMRRSNTVYKNQLKISRNK